jgi:hypothetical protein
MNQCLGQIQALAEIIGGSHKTQLTYHVKCKSDNSSVTQSYKSVSSYRFYQIQEQEPISLILSHPYGVFDLVCPPSAQTNENVDGPAISRISHLLARASELALGGCRVVIPTKPSAFKSALISTIALPGT